MENRNMESSDSDLVFTIRSKANNSEPSASSKRKSDSNLDNIEVSSDNEVVKILCLHWKYGKLGAAYYNLNEKLLYVYEEVVDFAPQFFVTHSLYREIEPTFILSFGSRGDDFNKMLIEMLDRIDESVPNIASRGSTLPTNLYLLPHKYYTHDICKAVIYQSLIASSSLEESQNKKELYIHSLINFDHKLSVHSLGALIKYMDKNWAFFMTNRNEMTFLHIHQVSMNMLLNPLNDIEELRKRLNFVNFILHPNHRQFLESFQDNIKHIVDVNMILSKIQNSRATATNWKKLYQTIYHCTFINELSGPYRELCGFLNDLCTSVSSDLLVLENTINSAIDFAEISGSGRPSIKFGLDESLDAKKLRRQDISKHINVAARIAVTQLPDYIDECSIVYLPEMGHLISIREWQPDCNPEDLQHLGFQFKFILRGIIHYKNPICLELDQCLGDINAEIIAHENRILTRLSGFVMKYNNDIRAPLRVVGIIDALVAMAQVAYQNNYICPSLNADNIHEIEDCRHPLLELVSNAQANSFHSGGKYSHIKVLTGPNGSGKSIYLKQIALILYLAHVGSYVPAKSANIGVMHSIHTRMQTNESASVRLSAFMIDIMQVSHALHTARTNSMILLDEFGKGTVDDDGFALLTGGILQEYHERGENCPHIVVATHFQRISHYLPKDPLIDHLKMSFSQEGDGVSYLYKITEGVSQSLAFEVAKAVGIDDDIINRAKEIFSSLKNNTPIMPLPGHPKSVTIPPDQLEAYLNDIDIPELDNSQ